MDDNRFWDLIAAYKEVDDEGRRTEGLSRWSARDLLEFRDKLLGKAALLSRAPNLLSSAESASTFVGDVPLSDDSVEDISLSIVAHGRKDFERARNGEGAGTSLSVLNGPQLLIEVERAYEDATGAPAPPSGSTEREKAMGNGEGVPPRREWFSIHRSTRVGGRFLRNYESHLDFIGELVNEDPRWWAWWDRARPKVSRLDAWVKIGAPGSSTLIDVVENLTDWAGRDLVSVTIVEPPARILLEEKKWVPAGAASRAPKTARAAQMVGPERAREHFDAIINATRGRLGILGEPPPLELDTEKIERLRNAKRQAESVAWKEEDRKLAEWNRHRSSEHIWRGRAPDVAVDELVRAVERGKRIKDLPRMIHELRVKFDISVEASDETRLAEAGYSPAEIFVALAPI